MATYALGIQPCLPTRYLDSTFASAIVALSRTGPVPASSRHLRLSDRQKHRWQ
jgi:hypothetical protein